MRWALRLFGWAYVPKIPWEPNFFEAAARALLEALPPAANVCLLGGLNSLGAMEAALRERPCRSSSSVKQGGGGGGNERRSFAAVAVARMVLHEPGIIRRMEARVVAARVVEVRGKQPSLPPPPPDDIVSGCSHCNLCIVGSTMAESPLVCVERVDDIEELEASYS